MRIWSEIYKICSHYEIQCFFHNRRDEKVNGYAFPTLEQIHLFFSTFEKSRESVWSVVFHEIGHIIAYRNGKYKHYHEVKDSECYFVEAIAAERYVDKIGKSLMELHFPEMEYVTSYKTKGARQWLRKQCKK